MKEPLLKPCPFCGGIPSVGTEDTDTTGEGRYWICRVVCSICGAEGPGIDAVCAEPPQDTIDHVAERWNRRATVVYRHTS